MAVASDCCIRELKFDHWLFAADWSPDGTRLAIGDRQGGVEVLTAEGRRLWRNTEHRGMLSDVRWSPDGNHVASHSYGGSFKIHDAGNGAVQIDYSGNDVNASFSWSPDSQRLACSQENKIDVIDPRTGALLYDWYIGGLQIKHDWSHDSRFLAAGVSQEGLAVVYIKAVEEEDWVPTYARLTGHRDDIKDVSWARTRYLLATSSWDHSIRVWNIEKRECILEIDDHEDNVHSVCWSPDDLFLASCSSDRTVRVWSTKDGSELICLRGHEGTIWSVCFSPDGSRLVSAAEDKTVRIWDVSDLLHRRERPVRSTFDAYVARQAATVGRRARRPAPSLWMPGSAAEDVLREFKRPDYSVDIFPDSRSLVVGGTDGSLKRLGLETAAPVWHTSKAHEKAINDVQLSPDGRLVASVSNDSTAKVTDVATGHTLSSFLQYSYSVDAVTWSPDSKLVAAASWKSATIHVWDARTSDSVAEYECGAYDTALSVDWSPNANLLAASSRYGRVYVWNLTDGAELARYERHLREVNTVRWRPDGRFLASGSDDNTVHVWEPGAEREPIRCEGHTGDVICVAWSRDGRLLASGSSDKTVRLWDPETGQELHLFSFKEAYARCLVWAPDSTFLAASFGSGAIRLWDVRRFLDLRSHSQPSTSQPRPLPLDLAFLPEAFAHLVRLGLPVPLSHLYFLLRIVGSVDVAAEPLTSHSGIRKLAALRWPTSSYPGLIALLLKNIPCHDEWKPPPGATPTHLRDALGKALTEPTAPDAPPLPVAALRHSADTIDERLLTLLELIGPTAVATDPGLPLRLLPQSAKLPALSTLQRRLLGMRLRLDENGPAHGHGTGADRIGIDLRGDLRRLLPSQLALPDDILYNRYVRGEILYRTRSGQEPPRLRPTVLVLDVSPPVFGPIEATTRLVAHVIASSLLEAGVPVILLTAGGRGSVHVVERRSDLVEIWTRRTFESTDEPGVLRVARALRETLADGVLEPVVVVLSHVFFGADFEMPEVASLRGLFVDYPGERVRPALASACERWESVGAGEVEGLGERLGRLVG